MAKIFPHNRPRTHDTQGEPTSTQFRRLRHFILVNTRPNLQYFYVGFYFIRSYIVYTVPFLGEFHKCSRSDIRQAAVELIITTFFSTMPLWIMPLVGPVLFKTDFSYVDTYLAL
jgi:hypothetical protein